MRKVLYLSLVFIMIAAILAGCTNGGGGGDVTPASTPAAQATPAPVTGGDEGESEDIPESWITAERVTFTLAADLAPNWAHPDDCMFFDWLEEETNVSINWVTTLHAEAAEHFSLMMASADYPDGFIGRYGGGDANILQYGSTLGVYIPLNDLIQEYAHNFLLRGPAEFPNLFSVMTAPDGNIYAMPRISDQGMHNRIWNRPFINVVWLDELGLEMPRTIEDLEYVLRAFRDRDPNGNGIADEVAMTFNMNCWGSQDHGAWFGMFGAPIGTDMVLIENGVVTFQGAQEYFRDGARWFAGLYAEGLIDLEVFTYDQARYFARLGGDPVLFGTFNAWSGDEPADNADYYDFLPPVRGPVHYAQGLWQATVSFNRDAFIITSAAPQPELMMQWVDVFYRDPYVAMNANYGMGPGEDMAWFINDEGLIQWNNPVPEAHIRGMDQLPFAPAILGEIGAAGMQNNGQPNFVLDYMESTQMPYLTNWLDGAWSRWPLTFMTPEESEEMAILQPELLRHANNMLARWMSGEGDVDAEWDRYLDELNSIGLPRWLEIRQGIYNRFLGN